MPFANSRARADPFIVRIHALLEIEIRDYARRNISRNTCDFRCDALAHSHSVENVIRDCTQSRSIAARKTGLLRLTRSLNSIAPLNLPRKNFVPEGNQCGFAQHRGDRAVLRFAQFDRISNSFLIERSVQSIDEVEL